MSVVAKNISTYNDLELKGYLLNLVAQTKDRSKLLKIIEKLESIFEQNEGSKEA